MKEKNCSENGGLEHILDTIAKFGGKSPMNHPSEADLGEYLQDYVAGLEWHRLPLLKAALLNIPEPATASHRS